MANRWINTLTHRDVTPRAAFLNRRQIMAGALAGVGAASIGGSLRAAPEGLEPRITLTGPVLRGAMSTHVLITGAEKRAAVERAARMKPEEAPIALVLGQATVHWAEE